MGLLFGAREGDYPITEDLADRLLRLPFFAGMPLPNPQADSSSRHRPKCTLSISPGKICFGPFPFPEEFRLAQWLCAVKLPSPENFGVAIASRM